MNKPADVHASAALPLPSDGAYRAWEDAAVRGGDSASEGALRASQAGVLHLAAQAFVLQPTAAPPERWLPGAWGEVLPRRIGATVVPSLGAGLTLSGLSGLGTGDAQDDGLVTAEEIRTLHLAHVHLVTLPVVWWASPGTPANDELRAAFLVAGAESVLYAQWQGRDPALDTAITRRLAEGADVVDAVYDTAREHGEGHPLSWGSWTILRSPWGW